MPAALAERGIPQQYTEWKVPTVQPPPVIRKFNPADMDGASAELAKRFVHLERPLKGAGTAAWIRYFDTNWQREGLPQDWYNLKSQQSNKRVGFIMSSQMDLLKDSSDRENVLDWAQKTRRDLQGFKLEFLSDHIVYPRKYQIEKSGDPNKPDRVEDPMYGKSKDPRYKYADIEEVVSEDERKGSVKRAMKEIKEFMVDAPVGSLTVLTSPLGPTGFKTDDGLGIDYPDSYFFVKVKTSKNEIMNYTIKTNFNLQECRAAILKLTGKELAENAPLEAYADALAKIKPGDGQGIGTIFDVVNILQEVHPKSPFVDKQNGKVTSWKEVYDDIVHGEDLYKFDAQTTTIIDAFTAYAEADKTRTKLDYQKSVAGTILLMGEHFFKPKQEGYNERQMIPQQWIRPGGIYNKGKFGDVLEQTATRRGCAGGGDTTTISTAGGERTGLIGSGNQEGFSCSECSFKASSGTPVGDTCPGCGFTKQQYAEKYGIVCD